ncbi:MAG: hypothetical protein AB7S50_11610 [Bacteroidales bacterium]
MKKNDLLFLVCFILFFTPFFISERVFEIYQTLNRNHGFVMSFFKFAILATLGESIGLRISKGVYNQKGFGLVSRAIVWGFLGLTIKMAFVIFGEGTPKFLHFLGFNQAIELFKGSFSAGKILVAFAISAAMNTIYAPVMMTLHKITDIHILSTGGTVKGLFTKIQFGKIITELNWDVQWNFVFKKTIPFFWIPAHTITFLLPAEYQVLFAAILGIILGLLLAIANLKSIK